MHRHGYKGRKFGRERDQRRALLKGLAGALIDNKSITTTLPKAKELIPYTEKLITKAKKGDLHNRRQIIAKLPNADTANKLIDEIVPTLTGRTSGHMTIAKGGNRRGDNAPMATVKFVEPLPVSAMPSSKTVKEAVETKPAAKKATSKSSTKPKESGATK